METRSIENLNWKKLLKMLKLRRIQEAAPGFFALSGGMAMGIKPYTDRTANGLTRAIIDYVCFTGGYANRISTTGTMRKINGEMRWTRGNGNRGAADIRVICRGMSADIEVKIGRDRMSEAQERERDRVTAAGGKYFVASSFPAFLEWWVSLGHEVPDMWFESGIPPK